MLDLIVKGNRYAEQAWLHLEAGDAPAAEAWARHGMDSAQARKNDLGWAVCLLLFGLVACSSGNSQGLYALERAGRRFEWQYRHLETGIALVCLALFTAHPQRRFILLERADAALETGMQRLAQAYDVSAWTKVKGLRERIADDVEQLLPAHILIGFQG
jgi:hypothetical protein